MAQRYYQKARAFIDRQGAGEWDENTLHEDAVFLADIMEYLRQDVLEEAAMACEKMNRRDSYPTPIACAKEIRNLKESL